MNSNKLLGVIIDKNLTWKFHINKTVISIYRSIALLRRIRKYLPHQTRITFYKSYIQPHIDYRNTVWGQSPYVNRIHILQKMVLRFIMNVPNLTHSGPLFHQCGVMPIQNRVKFWTVTTVYKSLNGLTSEYMKNMFEKVSNITTRSTRLSTTNSLYIRKRNLCVSRRTLHYSGATLYNTLDSSTQSCSSLSSFKHRAFKHFMWTCVFLTVFICLYITLYFMHPSHKRAPWKIRVSRYMCVLRYICMVFTLYK